MWMIKFKKSFGVNVMETDELLNYSKKIRLDAKDILEQTKVLEVLNKYGKTKIIGSYIFDLMYDKDLDIVVEAKDIAKSSKKALIEFIESENFSKVEYGNFIKFPRKNRPSGFIINLKIPYEDSLWEIEIWFLENISEYDKQITCICNLLDDIKRTEILVKKQERFIENIDKKNCSSYDIYKKILKL